MCFLKYLNALFNNTSKYISKALNYKSYMCQNIIKYNLEEFKFKFFNAFNLFVLLVKSIIHFSDCSRLVNTNY